MPYLRFSLRVIVLIVMLLGGMLTAGLLVPLFGQSFKSVMVKIWSKVLMPVCGVKIQTVGEEPILDGPVMWVANHVSWIDIFILNSFRSTSFVAKAEIRKWPVLGWLVAAVGTIFIDRSNRQAIPEVSKKMTIFFERNNCVGVFPEGTTSNGDEVLPFYSSLFAVPLAQHVPMQAVALVFYHHGRRSGHVSFIGEQTLVENIWVLLSTSGVSVKVVFMTPINNANEVAEMSRQQVSEQMRMEIRDELLK